MRERERRERERERDLKRQTNLSNGGDKNVFFLFCVFACQDGMGKLRIVPKGIRLEGEAEFVRPLYVQEIKAEEVSNSLCSFHLHKTFQVMPHIKSSTQL